MKKHLPGWAVLLIITLVAGLALGATYALTKDPIDEQARITAENARKAALPQASRFALFSKAEKPGSANTVDWIYAGLGQPKTMPLTLEDIDVLSGATLTSQAVVDGLNQAYAAYQADEREPAEKIAVPFSGEGKGFKGDPVYVEATFDDNVITSVSIGDDRFDETPTLGGLAREYAFQSQFTDPVGYVAQKTVKGFGGEVEVIAGVSIVKESMTMPLTLDAIDAVAGATLTSQAVVDGLNQAFEAYQADSRSPEDKKGVAFSGEGKGFQGDPVYVEATFDGDYIASVSIGDDRFNETPAMGGKVLQDEFQQQFTALQERLVLGGISVGGSNFSETAGLGAKSKDKAFTDQFRNKPVSEGLKLIKAGDEKADNTIDAITSATVTSTAVVNGVNVIIDEIKSKALGIADVSMPEKPDGAAVYSASSQGYRGPVYVEAAFDANGQVSYISVGDDSFAEDIGADAVKPKFMFQFIGKTAPVVLADVDALAGATITTNAVINALNDAYAQSTGDASAAPAPIVEPEPAAAADPTAEPAQSQPEIPAYTAEAQGCIGPVAVTVAFDGDKIASLTVGDDRFAETPGLGALAKEESFTQQFIGKAAPLTLSDIDALAGATITSQAVVDAVNAAYAQAAEPAAAVNAGESYTAEAQGCIGPVAVTIAFDGDKIASLTVGDDRFAETPGLGALAKEESFTQQFIGKTAPLTLSDIDALAGATITSQAVVDAVNAAYAQVQAAEPSKASLPAEEPTAEPVPEVTEAPAPEPAVEVTPEPTEEPTVEITPEPAVTFEPTNQSQQVPSSAAYTGECILFFDRITAAAVFDGDTLQNVNVSRVSINTGKDASDPADSFTPWLPLLGEKLPMNPTAYALPGVDEATVQAVIIAINDAYAKYQAGEAPDSIAETPALPGLSDEALPGGSTYRGSALAFFQNIEVAAGIEDGTLTSLLVFEKAVDAEAWDASPRQDEMNDLFVGSQLPLDTNQEDAYASAVAVAVNQAFLRSLPITDVQAGAGTSIMFFTRYGAIAVFDHGKIAELHLAAEPVTNSPDSFQQIEKPNVPTLENMLIGQSVPLDPAAFTGVDGAPEYVVRAIVLAINDAYGHPLPTGSAAE